MNLICQLNFSLIDIYIIINTEKYGFKCIEVHYLPIYVLGDIMDSFRDYVKKIPEPMMKLTKKKKL